MTQDKIKKKRPKIDLRPSSQEPKIYRIGNIIVVTGDRYIPRCLRLMDLYNMH